LTPYLLARENGTETGPDLLRENLLDEKGTLEAGLVIIPTTLLFLMILQVLFAGSWQVMERAKLHDLVINTSLSETRSERGNEEIGEILGSGRADESQYFRNNLNMRAEESFSPHSKLKIEEVNAASGNLHKIEVITPIPVLTGVFNFLGINNIGMQNLAVFIDY
jgi:hypothetical protein